MLTRLIYLTILLHCCNGAKILGVVNTPSYSHQVVFQPIWRELSLRGHQVTVLTTDPMKDPTLTNLTEIDLSSSYEVYNKNLKAMMNVEQQISLKYFEVVTTAIIDVAGEQLSHPEVQNLLTNQTEHFDLLMVEIHTTLAFAFLHHFKCPFIGIISYPGTSDMYKAMGNPTNPVLYPDYFLGAGNNENFLDRATIPIFNLFGILLRHLVLFPAQQIVAKKYFGKTIPPSEAGTKKMDMFYVNTNPIIGTVRPLVPGIVQIGSGIHRTTTAKPLPTELKILLDKAKDGFIFFSLGTNMKGKFLTEKIRNAILQSFSELPYTVLWKFELDALPNKPKNVYISKWVPQQDILKHPNIKLFITQGGMQSLEEAVYRNSIFWRSAVKC